VRDEDLTRRQRVAIVALTIAELPAFLLLVGGIYSALFWRPGAYVMLTGLLGLILVHVARGALMYRIVMSRPWPEVTPLNDEEDW